MSQSGEAISLSEAFERIDEIKSRLNDFGTDIQQSNVEEITKQLIKIDVQDLKSFQHSDDFVQTLISAVDHLGEYSTSLKSVVRYIGDVAFSDSDQGSLLSQEATLCWERMLMQATRIERAIENGVDWGARFIWDEIEDRHEQAEQAGRSQDVSKIKDVWTRSNMALLTCYNSCGAVENYIKKAAIVNTFPFCETAQGLLNYLSANNWKSYNLKPSQMH